MEEQADKGLDYYKNTGRWQIYKDIAWGDVDKWVSEGWFTAEERDLLKAWAGYAVEKMATDKKWSVNITAPFPEANAAYDRYVKVKLNGGPPLELEPPPKPGDDFYGRVSPGQWASAQIPKPVAEAPAVPAAGAPGSELFAVNTQALRVFQGNLVELQVMLAYSMGFIKQAHIKPGAFHSAFELRDKINGKGGSDGLVWDTYNFMWNASEAMQDIRGDIGKLIADYDTTEELNELSGEKLMTIMSESFADIDKSSSFGIDKSSNGDDGEGGGEGGDGRGGGQDAA